ncbi:MAG: SAM-dependent methyltransferase [Bacteroidales bacterium]|nr:SAM-dependent methyltransferase [Bacteroidales bacterium]
MSFPALYLIPRHIGEVSVQNYPSFLKDVKCFVCESEKGLRNFLLNVVGHFKMEDYEILVYNEHNVNAVENKLVFQKWLESKVNIGMMSDVGVPAVADPGKDLVMLAHRYEYHVIPLVHESSIIAALCASGLNGQKFMFHGYPPIDRIKLKKLIQSLVHHKDIKKYTHIFIEAPYRNQQLFQNLLTWLPDEIYISITVEAGTANTFSRTRQVIEWKNTSLPSINKKRVVFLFSYA